MGARLVIVCLSKAIFQVRRRRIPESFYRAPFQGTPRTHKSDLRHWVWRFNWKHFSNSLSGSKMSHDAVKLDRIGMLLGECQQIVDIPLTHQSFVCMMRLQSLFLSSNLNSVLSAETYVKQVHVLYSLYTIPSL